MKLLEKLFFPSKILNIFLATPSWQHCLKNAFVIPRFHWGNINWQSSSTVEMVARNFYRARLVDYVLYGLWIIQMLFTKLPKACQVLLTIFYSNQSWNALFDKTLMVVHPLDWYIWPTHALFLLVSAKISIRSADTLRLTQV